MELNYIESGLLQQVHNFNLILSEREIDSSKSDAINTCIDTIRDLLSKKKSPKSVDDNTVELSSRCSQELTILRDLINDLGSSNITRGTTKYLSKWSVILTGAKASNDFIAYLEKFRKKETASSDSDYGVKIDPCDLTLNRTDLVENSTPISSDTVDITTTGQDFLDSVPKATRNVATVKIMTATEQDPMSKTYEGMKSGTGLGSKEHGDPSLTSNQLAPKEPSLDNESEIIQQKIAQVSHFINSVKEKLSSLLENNTILQAYHDDIVRKLPEIAKLSGYKKKELDSLRTKYSNYLEELESWIRNEQISSVVSYGESQELEEFSADETAKYMRDDDNALNHGHSVIPELNPTDIPMINTGGEKEENLTGQSPLDSNEYRILMATDLAKLKARIQLKPAKTQQPLLKDRFNAHPDKSTLDDTASLVGPKKISSINNSRGIKTIGEWRDSLKKDVKQQNPVQLKNSMLDGIILSNKSKKTIALAQQQLINDSTIERLSQSNEKNMTDTLDVIFNQQELKEEKKSSAIQSWAASWRVRLALSALELDSLSSLYSVIDDPATVYMQKIILPKDEQQAEKERVGKLTQRIIEILSEKDVENIKRDAKQQAINLLNGKLNPDLNGWNETLYPDLNDDDNSSIATSPDSLSESTPVTSPQEKVHEKIEKLKKAIETLKDTILLQNPTPVTKDTRLQRFKRNAFGAEKLVLSDDQKKLAAMELALSQAIILRDHANKNIEMAGVYRNPDDTDNQFLLLKNADEGFNKVVTDIDKLLSATANSSIAHTSIAHTIMIESQSGIRSKLQSRFVMDAGDDREALAANFKKTMGLLHLGVGGPSSYSNIGSTIDNAGSTDVIFRGVKLRPEKDIVQYSERLDNGSLIYSDLSVNKKGEPVVMDRSEITLALDANNKLLDWSKDQEWKDGARHAAMIQAENILANYHGQGKIVLRIDKASIDPERDQERVKMLYAAIILVWSNGNTSRVRSEPYPEIIAMIPNFVPPKLSRSAILFKSPPTKDDFIKDHLGLNQGALAQADMAQQLKALRDEKILSGDKTLTHGVGIGAKGKVIAPEKEMKVEGELENTSGVDERISLIELDLPVQQDDTSHSP